MQCPRCGVDNADDRVACWNCFAQLHPVTSAEPQEMKAAPEPEPVVQPEPEAVPAAEVVQAPSPEEAVEEQAAEEPPVEDESRVLDLDEPVAESAGGEPVESGYIVPGLAEPELETETQAEVEEQPQAEAPEMPVFDIGSLDEEPEDEK